MGAAAAGGLRPERYTAHVEAGADGRGVECWAGGRCLTPRRGCAPRDRRPLHLACSRRDLSPPRPTTPTDEREHPPPSAARSGGHRARRRHPTTTVARTVVDLAGLLAPADLEYLLDDAICKRVTVARIRWRFEALTHQGRAGVATLGALLAERGRRYVPPQRQLEHRVLRLLKRSGVPAPVHQHPVYRDGTLLAKLDFAWPDQRVAIEADGFEVHGTSKRAFEHDRRRGNKVVLDRWLVLHVTWQRLDTDPDGFLAEVREALGLPTAA